MSSPLDTAKETDQTPEASWLGAAVERLFRRNTRAAVPVDSLPNKTFWDIDSRREEARARLGRELADLVEFF